MPIEFNILVISDLHLGEDLSACSDAMTARTLDLRETQLVEFVNHYSTHRHNGKPWQLVINGDMVDFLGLLLPEHVAFFEESKSWEQRTARLVHAPEKMRQVANRHHRLFRSLARFVDGQNRIEVICGNHDIEFHHESVQKVFVEAVLAHSSASSKAREHITFHPWFFYDPGVVWIEHGHQYDECSSFEWTLSPTDGETKDVAVNLDAAALQLITNHIKNANPQILCDWSMKGYFKFFLKLGIREGARLARAYGQFATTCIKVWRTRTDNESRKPEHDIQVAAIGEHWNVPKKAIFAIASLRKRPAIHRLAKLLSVLMLDRLAILAMLFVLAVALHAFVPLWIAAASTLIAGGVGFLGFQSLQKTRNVNSEEVVNATPLEIIKHVDVQAVIFGHTHEPVAQQIADNTFYYNTGTWMAGAKPGVLRAFTHVVISKEPGSARIRLCQWRDSASRDFTPGWVPTSDKRKKRAQKSKEAAAAANIQEAA